MATLFEQQGLQYKIQGDYRLPCVTLSSKNNYEIGVWGERHRRYLKEHHKVRYYNLLTAGTLDNYLADIENQAEKLFEQTVKLFAENENFTENLKAKASMEWVRKMNNIRNRAIEIVNMEVIFCLSKYYFYLTDDERRLIIESLISKKNSVILAGKYTDGIDDTLLKILRSKKKKS